MQDNKIITKYEYNTATTKYVTQPKYGYTEIKQYYSLQ